MNRICVYAASSSKIPERYKRQTKELIAALCEVGYSFVYGGGSTGLMGVTADTVLENSGKITGIIPGFMKALEWNHPEVEDMIVVETMAERKQLFLDHSDIIICLPGGCGTLEEISEAFTLKQLDQIHHPLFLVNFDGFYEPLIQQFEKMIELHCIQKEHENLWSVISSFEEFNHLIRVSETTEIIQQKKSKI